MAERNKVGEADPETRRKKLRELLDQPTKATGVAPKTALDAVKQGVKEGSDTLPNGQKRRVPSGEPKPKKSLVRRFGPKGETEEDMGL